MSIFSFEIGTTYAGRVNVETLTTTQNMAPKTKPLPLYAESIMMASGKSVGRGAIAAVWTWGFIPQDLFTALRVLCPGASAPMFIRTLGADYATYGYYTCQMTWPPLDSYEYRSGVYQPFELTFNRCLVYTP